MQLVRSSRFGLKYQRILKIIYKNFYLQTLNKHLNYSRFFNTFHLSPYFYIYFDPQAATNNITYIFTVGTVQSKHGHKSVNSLHKSVKLSASEGIRVAQETTFDLSREISKYLVSHAGVTEKQQNLCERKSMCTLVALFFFHSFRPVFKIFVT